MEVLRFFILTYILMYNYLQSILVSVNLEKIIITLAEGRTGQHPLVEQFLSHIAFLLV